MYMKVEHKGLLVQNETPLQAAGVIVFNASDEVLLVCHKIAPRGIGNKVGMLGFPAGIRDRGKTLRMTALAELEEETGIITIPEYLEEFAGNDPPASLIPRSNGKERLIAHKSYLYTGPKKFSPFQLNAEVTAGWYADRQVRQFKNGGLLLPNVFNQIHIARGFDKQLSR